MIAILEIVSGVLLLLLTAAVLALPGFLVAGALGLLVRRIAKLTSRRTWIAVTLWVLLCAAGAAACVASLARTSHPDPLDPLAELFYVLLGISSAVGGARALRVVARRGRTD